MDEQVIFFNTAWMRRYQGSPSVDRPTGGGKQIQREGWGSEIFNFKEENGKYFGYVEARGKVNIDRIGADPSDDVAENVLVVWTARRPKTGGTYIVGWYRNAKVYRQKRSSPPNSSRIHEGSILDYVAEADVESCRLLTEDERTFLVPRTSGGMGRHNVWYAEGNPGFVESVREYIRKHERSRFSHQRKRLSPRQPDVEKRKKVEKAAIKEATSYYESLGYTVKSVESDNRGWDLEATHGSIRLLVEVKGLSGSEVVADLTPNEYQKLRDNTESYRLCIVTDALDTPSLYVFSHSPDSGKWEDANGFTLNFHEIVRAQVSINQEDGE